MGRRLSRFRHLEWARGSRSAGDSPRRDERERFEALETDAAPPSELRSADGHLARFGENAGDAVLLQATHEGDAPFVRCIRCETENGRFASSCTGCGASFDTPEQRAFNERVWADRRAQLEEERARHAALQRAQLEEAVETAQQRRRQYEDLARRVGRETRARIEGDRWERLAGWLGRAEGGRRVRFNLGVAGTLVALLFAAASFTGGSRAVGRLLVMIGLVAGVVVVRWFLRRIR